MSTEPEYADHSAPEYHGLSACGLCGALVIVPVQHTAYHAAVKEAFDSTEKSFKAVEALLKRVTK